MSKLCAVHLLSHVVMIYRPVDTQGRGFELMTVSGICAKGPQVLPDALLKQS